MKHLGDITKINGADIEPVDCITFGAPCQDLSQAGLRKGMKHEAVGDDETTRSGLFYEAIRIIKEMRQEDERNGRTDEFIRPRWGIYENVPGATSSNGGEDFRCVLESLAQIIQEDAVIPRPTNGKWSPSGLILFDRGSIAWRVHDAQFWGTTQYFDDRVWLRGTPQRRKRIAVVADFSGHSAGEVLFERKSLPRDLGESQEERQGSAKAVRGRSDKTGESIVTESYGLDTYNQTMDSETAQPLRASEGGDTTPKVLETTAYTLKVRGGVERDCYGKKAGKGALVQTEKSATLGVSQDQTLIQIEE